MVSYNTDKYQEHNVAWQDCMDVISSSGHYPIDDWERQLDRIEAVVAVFDKPFFFAEAGCMSVEGSKYVPCPLVVGCRFILGRGKNDQGNCME